MSVTAVPIRPLASGSVLKLWIGLLVLALAAGMLAWVGTAGQQVTTTESGLRYRVIEEGTGPTITPADVVALRFKLRKEDGTLLQDSDVSGQPLVASTEDVYPGFAEGLQLMREGGRYMLWLPPGLHEQPPFPPNLPFTAEDTLVFEIQILQVAPGMAAMRRMMSAGPPPGLEEAEEGDPQGPGAPGGGGGQEP